jgi:putative transposase
LAAQLRQAPDQHEAERLRLQRRIFAEMEGWLDQSQWNPHLQQTDIAELVAGAIEWRHARGDWHMFEYVLMPTHAHLFFEAGSHGLKYALEDFKRWTAHQAAKILDTDAERFWQREWFDHWSRSDEEDDRIVAYIRNNPVNAGLVREYKQWPYESWSRSGGP